MAGVWGGDRAEMLANDTTEEISFLRIVQWDLRREGSSGFITCLRCCSVDDGCFVAWVSKLLHHPWLY